MRPVLTLRCVALQCRAHVSHPVPPGELSTHVDLVLQFADSCSGHSSFCLKKNQPSPPPLPFFFSMCACCITCYVVLLARLILCEDVGKTKSGPIKVFLPLSQEAKKSMRWGSASRLPSDGWCGTTESASASQPSVHR